MTELANNSFFCFCLGASHYRSRRRRGRGEEEAGKRGRSKVEQRKSWKGSWEKKKPKQYPQTQFFS